MFKVLSRGVYFYAPKEPAVDRLFSIGYIPFRREKGRSFFFFNTHFDHVGETARIKSASLLLKKINELTGGNPVILNRSDFKDIPPGYYRPLMESAEAQIEKGIKIIF